MLLKFGLANHWISEIWTHCSHGSKQSSYQRRSVKKAFLKNFTIYTGNACVGVLQVLWRFFKPATWKKRLERFQYRCFPLNIKKFFKTLILKNICKRLLLSKSSYNHITYIIYMAYIAYINLLIIYIKKIIHIYIYIIYMYIYIYIYVYIYLTYII